MYTVIIENYPVEMFVGLSDDEKKYKHKIFVDVKLYASLESIPEKVKSIEQCIDYTKVVSFMRAWETRGHVDLLETLRKDMLAFSFSDSRVIKAEINIKRACKSQANMVGVGAIMTREEYDNLRSY